MIATDAWLPQINGVVRSYQNIIEHCRRRGVEVEVLSPAMFRHVPCPTYAEIPLALVRRRDVAAFVAEHQPDHIHIATEGPIGLRTRAWCLAHGVRFTTSYHTRFPEYVAARLSFPLAWSYAFERRFHNAGNGVMVATRSLAEELTARGFRNILPWTRGVDTDLYRPRDIRLFGAGKPVLLFVGRVAIEKNLPAFLDIPHAGRKVVVGDGPQLTALKVRYPEVLFTGALTGERLAAAYASADVFVFPSRTDTFGIVLLEALASGLPVAAYPVTGPRDVLGDGVDGALDDDLALAIGRALQLDRRACSAKALAMSWASSATMFLDNIEQARSSSGEGA